MVSSVLSMISRRPGEPIQPGDDQRIARFQDRERLGERLAVRDGENDQLATDGRHTYRKVDRNLSFMSQVPQEGAKCGHTMLDAAMAQCPVVAPHETCNVLGTQRLHFYNFVNEALFQKLRDIRQICSSKKFRVAITGIARSHAQ
jgi:hypothetical protein